jgi:phosphoribosylformylglycinamidine cyclo-ligase
VKPVLELLEGGLPVRALAHITGDGLFNLVRTPKAVGYHIEAWPDPPPIFRLLQRIGSVSDEEMFRVFNMGIGFAVVVAPEGVDRVRSSLARAKLRTHVLGYATEDPARVIRFDPYSLVGRDGRFARS